MKNQLTLLSLIQQQDAKEGNDFNSLLRDALTLRELVMYDNLLDIYIEQCDFYREAPECTDILSTQAESIVKLICFDTTIKINNIKAYINAKCILAGRTENLPFEGIRCNWRVTAGYTRSMTKTNEYHAEFMDYSIACHAYERASTYTWRNLTFVGAY